VNRVFDNMRVWLCLRVAACLLVGNPIIWHGTGKSLCDKSIAPSRRRLFKFYGIDGQVRRNTQCLCPWAQSPKVKKVGCPRTLEKVGARWAQSGHGMDTTVDRPGNEKSQPAL